MAINKIKVRLLGKTELMFQVCRGNEVVQVLCTEKEAKTWMEAN